MYSKESLKRPTWVIRSRNSKNTFRSVFCLNLDLFVVDTYLNLSHVTLNRNNKKRI